MRPAAALAALLLAASTAWAADAEPKKAELTAFDPLLRDPFNFDGAALDKPSEPVSSSNFRLEGLIWRSDRPQAIVNGKIVEPGARIGAAEVLEIGEKGVKMRQNGKEFVLSAKGS